LCRRTEQRILRPHRTIPSRVTGARRLPRHPGRGEVGCRKGLDVNDRIRPRLPRRRRDVAILALLLLATLATLLPGIAVGKKGTAHDRMGEFLWGLAGQESGWDYTARNASSGAYGKYQVMPDNWPAWADLYLGDRWADQSPYNQELVVRGKIGGLRDWLGGWRRVAYWWLTGDTETDEKKWSDLAAGYVDNVTALMKRAPKGGDPIPPAPSGDAPPAERGDWRYVVDGAVLFDSARHGRPIGDLHDGQIVFVQGARWADRGVLWMRVSTASDAIGWVSIRRTTPARRPPHADHWPTGGRITGPDPRHGRERARPRPR